MDKNSVRGFQIGETVLTPLLTNIVELEVDALVEPSGTSPVSTNTVLHVAPWVIAADSTGTIVQELAAHAPLELGTVIVTTPGKLRAKYLFHAIVIDWALKHPSQQLVIDEVVALVTRQCIKAASALHLRSIAFTPWGTRAAAARAERITALMLHAIVDQLHEQPTTLKHVYLVSNNYEHYQWFVDRSFVFHVLSEQLLQVRHEIKRLDIPPNQRNYLLTLLENLNGNVLIYNEIINGNRIDTGGGAYIEGSVQTGADFIGRDGTNNEIKGSGI
jgi:O-acetyl-ADP-ribose deacetylase (regulator of RNase III)